MAADAEAISEVPAGGPQPAGRAAPGLWVSCVVMALAGALFLPLAALGTLLGVLLFGGLSLFLLTGAAGLWVRSRLARVATMVGLSGLTLVVAAALARASSLDARIVPGLAAAAAAAIVVYLWRRGDAFGPHLRRRLWPPQAAGVVAALLVPVPATAWSAFVLYDEPRRDVPALALDTTPVPEEENAYPILLRIQAQWPTDPDEDLEWVFENTPDGVQSAPAEWQKRAAESLRRRQERLDLAHEMVDRPYFAPPLGDRPPGVLEWLEEARATVSLLMVESAAELAAGRPAEALEIACRTAEFGVKMCEGSDSLVTSLVGMTVGTIGLRQVRIVALSSSTDAATAVGALPSLDLDDQVVGGLRRALRAEYRCTDLMMARMARVEDTESVPGARTARLLFRRVPIMKPGMAHNLLGDVVAGVLARTEGYTPAPPEALQPTSAAGRVGRTHVLLDPVGSILVLMLEPALHRAVDAHFTGLAELGMTRLLLALRAYELEQGALPDSLDDLVPRYLAELPLDPFTERPFAYDLQADTPCLRSAGPDGQVDRRPREEGGDDTTVELRLPGPEASEPATPTP